jgi:UDP-glucose/GDP-mannose dehydrogenase family protein
VNVRVHDPYVEHWYEFILQDTYPAPGKSRARFFSNQEVLKELSVEKDITSILHGTDALILAVPHQEYLSFDPDKIVKWTGKPLAIIDCFGMLKDDTIRQYFRLGCEVKALGRGHVQRLKEEVLNRS